MVFKPSARTDYVLLDGEPYAACQQAGRTLHRSVLLPLLCTEQPSTQTTAWDWQARTCERGALTAA